MRFYQRFFYCSLFLLLHAFTVNAQSSDVRVVTHKLTASSLTSDLVLSGTLKPLRKADLSIAVESLVTALHVDVGSNVKKGDLLLELDNELAKQQHIRALAQVDEAETLTKEAKRLWDEGLRLQKQSHIAQSEISALESNVTLAQSRLAQAHADAFIAAKNLNDHKLYAPFDGVISARWTDYGQWLTRGDQVFTLVSLNNLRLDVQLPQEQLNNIKNLQSVSMQLDSQPNIQIPARIDTLLTVGDSARSFLVRVMTDKESPLLLPGVSAQALFNFEHQKNAVILPKDAVLRNVDGNYTVFVVKDGIAKRRSIVLGKLGKNGYLIENGLMANELVVTRGNELLIDGASVAIVNELELAQ
ncbi:efflux RND transporter periplasmic adaptor subunit [Colwellia sp. E2M01]|uniref:efflux RND transporter periplasmic adaptor subunit n=1 Tax=Colwellia sp. E2M01 TaxID=2841561 RepID=UPI001C0924A9|nr:efflux RND transporter periplasmic adaptor subunit [Colwellia sp. E2M01]MBU2870161.1 efflux RND transporter periplasmic adaptor subunit [Colwellia sp. E2M01]